MITTHMRLSGSFFYLVSADHDSEILSSICEILSIGTRMITTHMRLSGSLIDLVSADHDSNISLSKVFDHV